MFAVYGTNLLAHKSGKVFCMEQKTFGEMMRDWREASGLNAKEMATGVGDGVKYQNIQQMEAGAIPRYMPALARFMGCTVDDLYALRLPPPHPPKLKQSQAKATAPSAAAPKRNTQNLGDAVEAFQRFEERAPDTIAIKRFLFLMNDLANAPPAKIREALDDALAAVSTAVSGTKTAIAQSESARLGAPAPKPAPPPAPETAPKGGRVPASTHTGGKSPRSPQKKRR